MEGKITPVSILLELLAVGFLMLGNTYNIFLFLIFHTVASVLLSVVVWTFFPKRYKKPFPLSIIVIFIIMFSTPVLSYIAVLFSLIIFRKQKKLPVLPLETVPVFQLIEEKIQVRKRKFGESSVREFVLRKNLPSSLRLKAFLFLTEVKSPESVRLLRYGLSDENDEIRLLSFSVLDKIEKRLSEQIHNNLEKLKKAKDEKEKGIIYRELSKLYWEIIYIGMADKEITDFYLNESERYALKAKDIIKNDPYIDLLLGRIYLLKGRLDDSYIYLTKALDSNIPEFKVAPYLAEIFFRNREYSRIKEFIKKHPYLKYDPSFYPVAVLWEEG
ncbi:MAG TPA: hypothetical protein DEP48_00840 [Persephonella sp.]|uniref:Uncharacterized protein n=1 Tax=Persephonella marina (strain DSM 14350 / EX-H1) TaxID=123214 RepID=C0QR34_PERMH|nr:MULTISPECIES: hypothetical protein [Persephonella]ACO04261.1 conserved hypothetical protein [Persephonella marina EX-H1]HCB68881.1 hypothetical protein [Persephonella sp.]